MSLLIYGRNSVCHSIESSRAIKLYIAKGFNDNKLLSLAKSFKVPTIIVDNNKLVSLVNSNNTQGVVCEIKDYEYYSLDKLIDDGKKVKNPIIVMLDGIEDPHNLGAILRIVDAFNALGVIIKKNNQVHLNATVSKVSTGAINFVKVVDVSNLNNAIKKLKDNGYWIISTDGEGDKSYTEVDTNCPIVLIIGSEGYGISRLVKENSDYIVKIPMYGHVNSLNASNALSVVLSHIVNCK